MLAGCVGWLTYRNFIVVWVRLVGFLVGRGGMCIENYLLNQNAIRVLHFSVLRQ
jgi:hypothetical protein